MISRFLLGLLILFCALWPSRAAAQEQEIVVLGRTAEQVGAFVSQISAPPQGVDQLGRWDRDICPSVTGLSQEQGQLVVDRISMRAAAVDLRFGQPGCSANVFIFFAADSNAFAQRLFEERREMFAYHRTSAEATRSRAALDDFLNQRRPVRWWHVMQFSSADGERVGDSEATNSSPVPPTEPGDAPDADPLQDVQAVRGRASRLRSAQRVDVARAIIVVDGVLASQAPLTALGDYLAMVILAQIEPGAQVSDVPSILNLFEANSGVRALTDWDLAYLDALYKAPRDAASVRQQTTEIARRMSQQAAQ